MQIRIRLLSLTGVAFCASLVAGQAPPDLQVVTGGVIQGGFDIGLSGFGKNLETSVTNSKGTLEVQYPGGDSPGVAFITSGLAVKTGRQSIDVSGYQGLVVDMYGDGPFSISVGIKSADQDDFGHETKVLVNVSQYQQQYYFPLSWFTGVDLKHVYVMGEVVFSSNVPQKLYIRSVRYTTNGYSSTRILPHIAFGGGWYSALYLTNTSGASVPVQIDFVGVDGSPLPVPVSGSSSMVVGLNVLLGPRATSVVELPNQGSLTQGYATISLPPDVAGYSLLRQSVQGQPDQQAILPLSGVSAMTSTLAVNETDSMTTAVIVNIDNVENSVLVVVRDETGQAVGASTLVLLGKNRTALMVLRNLPGLSALAGKRASIDFIASTGHLAVLGLRLVGAAFASIPTVDR